MAKKTKREVFKKPSPEENKAREEALIRTWERRIKTSVQYKALQAYRRYVQQEEKFVPLTFKEWTVWPVGGQLTEGFLQGLKPFVPGGVYVKRRGPRQAWTDKYIPPPGKDYVIIDWDDMPNKLPPELVDIIREAFTYPSPRKPKTFAVPSHPLMFTLVAMFAGRPEKIPRKLLEKPYKDRTLEEQKQADEFLDAIFEQKPTRALEDLKEKAGKDEIVGIALVSDSPRVEAKAGISGTLFSKDFQFREESLGIYIKRIFGPVGLRHLLGLLIGLDDNLRQGTFSWSVNEHLERLGYRKIKGGRGESFSPELKKMASEIVKIFTSLFITEWRKDRRGKRIEIEGKRLFYIEGFQLKMFNKEILDERITLGATNFWYKHAFEPPDGESPQYTKLLRKIARVNHQNHPLTIYLAPLLAIFWRIDPRGKSLSVKNLMEWCNLDAGRRKMENIHKLQAELDYMKEHGFLGDWKSSGENPLPSKCQDPLKCILTLTPPYWLKKEFRKIMTKKETFRLTGPQKRPLLTKEEIATLIKKLGYTQQDFANHIGKSRQWISGILRGTKHISRETSDKIREKFGHLLPPEISQRQEVGKKRSPKGPPSEDYSYDSEKHKKGSGWRSFIETGRKLFGTNAEKKEAKDTKDVN
jgi:transcriptional regulator with XRE-family HTH domain